MISFNQLTKLIITFLAMHLRLISSYDGVDVLHTRKYPKMKRNLSEDSGFDSSSNEEKTSKGANPSKVESNLPENIPSKEIYTQKFLRHSFPQEEVVINATSTDAELKMIGLNLTELPTFITEKMIALKILDLSDNPELRLPDDYGVIKKTLKILRLRRIQMTKEQLSIILKQFECLEELDVSENLDLKFSNNLGKVGSTLRKLNVRKTNMNFRDLKRLKFQNLRVLRFDNNSLNDITATDTFPNFQGNLKNLSVSGCKLTYDGLISITELNLEYLNISFNCFNKTKFEDFAAQKEIIDKWLPEKYNFSGISNWYKKLKQNFGDAKFKAVRFARAIYSDKDESKDYSINWLRPSEIDESFTIGNLGQSLIGLKMRSCLLDSKILSYFIKNLKKLKTLDIHGNNFRDLDKHYNFFSLSRTLEELDVGWCNMTSRSIFAFQKLKNLKNLNLSQNKFDDLEDHFNNPENLTEIKMPSIKTLDASYCYLTEDGLVCLKKIFPNVKDIKINEQTMTKSAQRLLD